MELIAKSRLLFAIGTMFLLVFMFYSQVVDAFSFLNPSKVAYAVYETNAHNIKALGREIDSFGDDDPSAIQRLDHIVDSTIPRLAKNLIGAPSSLTDWVKETVKEKVTNFVTGKGKEAYNDWGDRISDKSGFLDDEPSKRQDDIKSKLSKLQDPVESKPFIIKNRDESAFGDDWDEYESDENWEQCARSATCSNVFDEQNPTTQVSDEEQRCRARGDCIAPEEELTTPVSNEDPELAEWKNGMIQEKLKEFDERVAHADGENLIDSELRERERERLEIEKQFQSQKDEQRNRRKIRQREQARIERAEDIERRNREQQYRHSGQSSSCSEWEKSGERIYAMTQSVINDAQNGRTDDFDYYMGEYRQFIDNALSSDCVSDEQKPMLRSLLSQLNNIDRQRERQFDPNEYNRPYFPPRQDSGRQDFDYSGPQNPPIRNCVNTAWRTCSTQ